MAKKSCCLAYFLLLVGGFIGLHHLYLGRDRQAFIWWMTLGGYFGFGCFTDLFCIPRYVADANDDEEYMEKLARKMRKSPRPKFSLFRFVLQVFVAESLGYLSLHALPTELIFEKYLPFAMALVPFCTAVGVHMVGNIGRQEGSFLSALLGAFATYPLYFTRFYTIFATITASIYTFNAHGKQWRRAPYERRSFGQRILRISVCGLLYLIMLISFFYFNCSITPEDGPEVKCRDAAQHFFTSPVWNEFLSVLKEIREYAGHHGWYDVWRQVLQAFDVNGRKNALKVLNLADSASEQEITISYRRLSRKWHPDMHKSPAEKEAAQAKFIEIQLAYEVLSSAKSQRVARNEEYRLFSL